VNPLSYDGLGGAVRWVVVSTIRPRRVGFGPFGLCRVHGRSSPAVLAGVVSWGADIPWSHPMDEPFLIFFNFFFLQTCVGVMCVNLCEFVCGMGV
jgi:hypothetical protein